MLVDMYVIFKQMFRRTSSLPWRTLRQSVLLSQEGRTEKNIRTTKGLKGRVKIAYLELFIGSGASISLKSRRQLKSSLHKSLKWIKHQAKDPQLLSANAQSPRPGNRKSAWFLSTHKSKETGGTFNTYQTSVSKTGGGKRPLATSTREMTISNKETVCKRKWILYRKLEVRLTCDYPVWNETVTKAHYPMKPTKTHTRHVTTNLTRYSGAITTLSSNYK
jgi:hypothetical protein